MKRQKPLIAVTMGDPTGIGPEIVAKAWAEAAVRSAAEIVVVGDAATIARILASTGVSISLHVIRSLSEARFDTQSLHVLDMENVPEAEFSIGEVLPMAGKAAYEYIERAIALALAGNVDAVVTAPIHKQALHMAGFQFDGHTEIFAKQTGASDVTMMLASDHFRVTHVSTHCALREAIERCKQARIIKVIRLTVDGLQQMGFEKPRIAVAGLNPHSGEGGIFGREEIDEIQPAIDAARAEGFDIYPTPIPPDTVFYRMHHKREFDAVVAQYHDQGHIPSKLVDFAGGINVTLGLPIIRTSVDHGTAHDIAGRGIANPESLVKAIALAGRMALHRSESRAF